MIRSQKQVGLSPRELVVLILLGRDDDRITDNGTESINLRSELNLDDVVWLQYRVRFLGVGREWGVGSDEGAWRDGRRMSDPCDGQ